MGFDDNKYFMDSITKLKNRFFANLYKHVPWFRTKVRIVVWLSISLFFFTCSALTEYIHHKTSYHIVNITEVQRVFTQKESYAISTIKKLKSYVKAGNLKELHLNRNIYKESETNEVSFLIYKGANLLYWTSNAIAINGVDEFEFSREFLYNAGNAVVVVLQSFEEEYRYVALIKIKDNTHPKKNSPYNKFANDFNIPGSVIIEEPSDGKAGIKASDGTNIFSLSNTYVHTSKKSWLFIAIIFAVLFFISLFPFANSIVNYYKNHHEERYKPAYIFCIFAMLVLFILLAAFQLPPVFFDNEIVRLATFHAVVAPTTAHLFLYVLFLYGILWLKKRHPHEWSESLCDISNKRRWIPITLLKLVSFALMILFFLFIKELVMHSNLSIVVPYIQEVSIETYVMLILTLLLSYLLYDQAKDLRKIYAKKENTKTIVIIHVAATTAISLGYHLLGNQTEAILTWAFSIVLLFVDLYETYYPISRFLYTAPISFFLINIIVVLFYHYSLEKNEIDYTNLAQKLCEDIQTTKDDMAEEILRRNDYFIKADPMLQSLIINNSTDKNTVVAEYLNKKYFKSLSFKYDVEVEICGPHDSLHFRKTNYDTVAFRYFSAVQTKRIGRTIFFSNADEKLSVSYIGAFRAENQTSYVKFYKKKNGNSTYSTFTAEASNEAYIVSKAKYHDGELIFSEGEYHFPQLIDWTDEYGTDSDFSFSKNRFVHYVHKQGKDTGVISIPKRKSYIYVILVSYLFIIYIIVAILIFSGTELLRKATTEKKSLLTKMQMMFVIPTIIAFMVLATVTFPFFLDQYEKSEYKEFKEYSLSMQQCLQQIVGVSTDLKGKMEELSIEATQLATLFQTDIQIYDIDGRMQFSTSPAYLSSGDIKTLLVNPRIKFRSSSELFLKETIHSSRCYSQYVEIYNLRNDCVGYLQILSHKAFHEVRNEIVNLLAVVVDIYLFISTISIFIVWLLNKHATKPLSLLSERLAQIRLTGKNSLVNYQEDDEIGELVNRYNTMVAVLEESAEKLARSEREFAWREMARRISHEIRNPLTPMKLSIQQCQRKQELDPDNFNEYFKKTAKILIDQINNLSNIAASFSTFAKISETKFTKVDLVEKLKSSVELFGNNTEDVNFILELNDCKQEYIWMDEKQTLQVFNNLFRNAIQAIPNERKGIVETTLIKKDESLLVQIKDNGCGIPEETQKNIFQPNFTTKTSGMGLGLAIVKNIMLSAGGDIWFESSENIGTCFFLSFPRFKDEKNDALSSQQSIAEI